MSTTTKDKWLAKAANVLCGRKIVAVRYMRDSEADDLGWHCKSLVLTLDDGTIIFPSADDEGNDAGAIHYQKEGDSNTVLPVIY